MQPRLLQHIKYNNIELDLWKVRNFYKKYEIVITDNRNVQIYEFLKLIDAQKSTVDFSKLNI